MSEPKTEPMNLLPCPFCGGEASRDYISDCYSRTIGCSNCLQDYWMSDDEWNTRAANAELKEALEIIDSIAFDLETYEANGGLHGRGLDEYVTNSIKNARTILEKHNKHK